MFGIIFVVVVFGPLIALVASIHNDQQKKQVHRPNYWEILPQDDPPVTAPFYESGGRYG